MRIALLAPLYESVPPKMYGGTERVVSWLADELVRRGHEVTLFASGDSRTLARLVAVIPHAIRLAPPKLRDPIALHLAMAEQVRGYLDQFDIVHSHMDYLAFPALARMKVPLVATLHWRTDVEGLDLIHDAYRVPLVSISDSQRTGFPGGKWVATVYHGLPLEQYPYGSGRGDYVVFIGRISPEKRCEVAIRAARKTGLRLLIAAKIEEADRRYYDSVVRPLLTERGMDFIGEVDDAKKNALLRDARALLFPVQWPEPFGLIMIESMASGTPVVASRAGAVPEVIEDGVTGFICDDEDSVARALQRVEEIDRAACRASVEKRFTVERMAADYERVYQSLISRP